MRKFFFFDLVGRASQGLDWKWAKWARQTIQSNPDLQFGAISWLGKVGRIDRAGKWASFAGGLFNPFPIGRGYGPDTSLNGVD